MVRAQDKVQKMFQKYVCFAFESKKSKVNSVELIFVWKIFGVFLDVMVIGRGKA